MVQIKIYLSHRIFVLFLSFSFVLSTLAVPTTRSLKSTHQNPPSSLTQDLDFGEEQVDLGEGFVQGRMDLESNDYPGTGANHNHDPKTPGKP